MRFVFTAILSMCIAGTAQADGHLSVEGEAKFDRTTLIVRDIGKSFVFWRDVMGFAPMGEPRDIPAGDANPYLGWDETAERKFTVLYSPDGAGLGLLEVTQEGFPSVDISEHPTGYGGVVLVHTVQNIQAVYERALAAEADIMKHLAPSPTGRSLQMYLKSPSGHVIEMYELLPSAE